MAQRRNVLLIETSRNTQSSIDTLLRGTPFKLSAYSDRWAAFRAMKRSKKFDIVLIDKDMAQIGYEQALFPSMLQHLKKDMKVVVLSEDFPVKKDRVLVSNGFRNFLSKAELDSKLLPTLRSQTSPDISEPTKRSKQKASPRQKRKSSRKTRRSALSLQ